MHDKFGNEIKRGDLVEVLRSPPVMIHGVSASRIKREGVVTALHPQSNSCNVEVAVLVPQFSYKEGAPDLDGALMIAAQNSSHNANECAVMWAVDGRELNIADAPAHAGRPR